LAGPSHVPLTLTTVGDGCEGGTDGAELPPQAVTITHTAQSAMIWARRDRKTMEHERLLL